MVNSIDPRPTILEGTPVRPAPRALTPADDVGAGAPDPEIWKLLISAPIQTLEEMRAWIEKAEKQTAAGTQVWFAAIRRADNRAVGVTSYLNISHADRGLEIGGTWLSSDVWRTAVNTECKYLLLRHAFETLGCIRVQLKTDERNVRSQRAIERLGAVREGVLRKYQVTHSGYQRNTVMYSILDTEWLAVKQRLEEFLKR